MEFPHAFAWLLLSSGCQQNSSDAIFVPPHLKFQLVALKFLAKTLPLGTLASLNKLCSIVLCDNDQRYMNQSKSCLSNNEVLRSCHRGQWSPKLQLCATSNLEKLMSCIQPGIITLLARGRLYCMFLPNTCQTGERGGDCCGNFNSFCDLNSFC